MQDLLREWTKASIAMCAGSLVPGSSTQLDAPPADTGEAAGPAAVQADHHGRVSGPRCSTDRFGLAGRRPAALQDIPPLPARRPGPGTAPTATSASRPAPTTRRWRSTRSATWPGSAAASWRCAGPSSGFGRTSSTSTGAGHAAQPDGLQGRHPQRARRGRSRTWTPTSGSATRATRPWMRGGVVPRHPADPDAHRGLGPRLPAGPGGRDRPGQDDRCAARRAARVRRARTSPPRAPTASW